MKKGAQKKGWLEEMDRPVFAIVPVNSSSATVDEQPLLTRARRLEGEARNLRLQSVVLIQQACCAEWGIGLAEMLGHSHLARFATPRLIAVYLARRLSGLKGTELARIFARGRTNPEYAMKVVPGWMDTEPGLRTRVELVETLLREKLGGETCPQNTRKDAE